MKFFQATVHSVLGECSYTDDEWHTSEHLARGKFAPYMETGDTMDIGVLEVPSALYVTTAPVDYDGFGTRTIAYGTWEGRKTRVVDVQDQHANWQVGRYRSGMHLAVTMEVYEREFADAAA